jgi:hypothetical protein
MEETTVIEQPVAEAPAPAAPADPFSLDESKLAILTPEQRAQFEPVLNEWKTKAKQEIEKSGKTYEEKYKPHMEKATALDQLVRNPQFQQWWNSQQQMAAQANPQGASAIGQTHPQDFASPQEWQEAVLNASTGDSSKLREIQARMFSVMATPVVNQIRQGQEELRTMFEMKDLFDRNPDAKRLDAIGRDPANPNDKSTSLLEMYLNWATDNGKTLQEGYDMAKKIMDQASVGAKQEAMGMVQDKKGAVTSGPSTAKGGKAVVEVADTDELMAKRMEYALAGQDAPQFVIRQSGGQPQARWAQKT